MGKALFRVHEIAEQELPLMATDIYAEGGARGDSCRATTASAMVRAGSETLRAKTAGCGRSGAKCGWTRG